MMELIVLWPLLVIITISERIRVESFDAMSEWSFAQRVLQSGIDQEMDVFD